MSPGSYDDELVARMLVAGNSDVLVVDLTNSTQTGFQPGSREGIHAQYCKEPVGREIIDTTMIL